MSRTSKFRTSSLEISPWKKIKREVPTQDNYSLYLSLTLDIAKIENDKEFLLFSREHHTTVSTPTTHTIGHRF